MSITHRVRRLLVAGVAGAMVLSLMPAGMAAADEHDDVCDDAPEFEFADADSIADVHIDNVNCMAAYGITIGVDDVPNFAPGANVTRQQMALFIARTATQALNGDTEIPEAEDGPFLDLEQGVPDAQRNAINWLYSLGITTGVTETSYNPGGNVTREQMASFIARAHDELGVFDIVDLEQIIEDFDGDPFTDIEDASEVHRPNIEALQAVGVIGGFADGSYGPALPVTRQQMSRFIMESARVLDSVGRWNGQFIAVDVPTYALDLSIVGETPTTPTEPTTPATPTVPVTVSTATTTTFSTTLIADDGEGDVEGLLMQFAIFGGIDDIMDVVDLDTGVVDTSAIVSLPDPLVLDETGVAEFVYGPGALPPGTHLALAWAADGEPVFNAGEALAFDFLVFTVVPGEYNEM